MTLERLNNRSVKSIKRMIVVGLSLILTVNLITSTPRSARAEADAPDRIPSIISSPALQGAASIANLKKRGLFDSLCDALSAARGGRGDYYVIAPPLVNERKLTVSDGVDGGLFGVSVAISGSTIVVAPHKDFLLPH